MSESIRKSVYTTIPTQITKEMLDEFFLLYLSLPKRGPKCKIGYLKIFNYILKILYTEMAQTLSPKKGGNEIGYSGHKHQKG